MIKTSWPFSGVFVYTGFLVAALDAWLMMRPVLIHNNDADDHCLHDAHDFNDDDHAWSGMYWWIVSMKDDRRSSMTLTASIMMTSFLHDADDDDDDDDDDWSLLLPDDACPWFMMRMVMTDCSYVSYQLQVDYG